MRHDGISAVKDLSFSGILNICLTENNEENGIISFEKRTFEEIAAKLDRFVQRVESLCREHGGKETGEWMDNHEVCRRLRISLEPCRP